MFLLLFCRWNAALRWIFWCTMVWHLPPSLQYALFTCGSWSLMCSCQREEGRETHSSLLCYFYRPLWRMFNSVPQCDYKLKIINEIYWQIILLLILSTMSVNCCTADTTQCQLKKALEPRIILKDAQENICMCPCYLSGSGYQHHLPRCHSPVGRTGFLG